MTTVNGSYNWIDSSIELFQQSWVASGDYCQYEWEHKILPVIGVDEWTHYCWGVGFWLNYAIYLFLAVPFTIVDVLNWPKFIVKFKVQPGTNKDLNMKKIFEILKVVLINQTLVPIPLVFVAYAMRQMRDIPDIYTLPTLATFLSHIFICFIADDFGYYVVHRFILHNRRFYKYVHKTHHELAAPIALSTIYCSPLEHVVNLGTVAIGPTILQLHISTLLIWVFYSSILPIHNHLGYEIPYLFPQVLFPPASKHDFHHENPVNEMYGKNSVSDYLFGTDKRWRQSMLAKENAAKAITKKDS